MLQYCVYVCCYFGWVEWFDYVVVGIYVQCGQFVQVLVQCSQYDYWCFIMLVQLGQYVLVIQVWQLYIEQDQVGVGVVMQVQCVMVIGCVQCVQFFVLQVGVENIGDFGFIFDDQDESGEGGGGMYVGVGL